MGKDIIDPDIVDNRVIAATLIAACVWDLLTWYWGLPTSSSHALIGGLVGAALVSSRVAAPCSWDGIGKTRAVHRAGAADRHDPRASPSPWP